MSLAAQTFNRAFFSNTKVYADFTSNLDIHPDTGDLFLITNENAIKSSLKNILLTTPFERFYAPNFGSLGPRTLFEQKIATTIYILQKNIENSINLYEPRVNLQDISIQDVGDNSIQVTIIYTSIFSATQTLSVIIS